jgi:hypothetical protein
VSADELEQTWTQLPTPSGSELSGVRAPHLPDDIIAFLAVDAGLRQHLLVHVGEPLSPSQSRTTRGLSVSTEFLRVGNQPERLYLDLLCPQPSMLRTFAAVAADVLHTLRLSHQDPAAEVLQCLERWRWFWSFRGTGLSPEVALGLFAELWFLDRWLGPSVENLARWQGPRGARHDFQWKACSVEVKATAVRGAVVHRVNGLEQLEAPETGALLLFSLHVQDDALAGNSLPSLVGRVTDALAQAPGASAQFLECLAIVGYNPAEADRYTRPLRVLSEELFEVRDGFPRLTRPGLGASLPAGIDQVSYTLAMAACRPWRIAAAALDPIARRWLQ